MVLLCGVFFPSRAASAAAAALSAALPLTHAIDLARPLVTGRMPAGRWLHMLAFWLAYAAVGFYAALVLTRRRLLT